MSYEGDFLRFVEIAGAEMECRIWKAECAVAEAEARQAELNLYLATYPDSPLAVRRDRLQKMARQQFASAPPPLGRDRSDKSHRVVERAAYGWRRDYDEWPSWFNLVDRICEERRIYRSAAQRRIVRALNCRTDDACLYAIAHEDLRRVLAEEEPGTRITLPQPIEAFRFYVTAEGIAAHDLEEGYEHWSLIQRCRQPA